MSSAAWPSNERLLELLADRATEGLSAADERALEALLGTHPEVEKDLFELPAAAIQLVGGGPERIQALPPELDTRLRQQAREFSRSPRREAAPARGVVVPFATPAAASAEVDIGRQIAKHGIPGELVSFGEG